MIETESSHSSWKGEMSRDAECAFYEELVNVVDSYLFSFWNVQPAESLQYFVSHMKAESEGGYSCEHAEAKVDLLLQIRIAILNYISRRKKRNTKDLEKDHMILHIAELSILDDMSYFEKVNTFLNTNFKLDNDDITGHALRGNFSDVIAIKPSLSPMIESFLEIEDVKKRLNTHFPKSGKLSELNYTENYKERIGRWEREYINEKKLIRLMTGREGGINDEMENFCYHLVYKNPFVPLNKYIRFISGDQSKILAEASGYVKLILLLLFPQNVTLNEFEEIFEEIYNKLIKKEAPQLAFRFLAYSSRREFFFNIFVSKNNILTQSEVEYLIRYANTYDISNTLLAYKYISILERERNYSQICRFIVLNSVSNIEYSPDLLKYFVKHYDCFRSLTDEKFIEDKNNYFIHNVGLVKTCDYKTLESLLNHPYSDYFVQEIAEGVLENKNSDSSLAHSCLGKIIEIENKSGNCYKEAKIKMMEKILNV